MSISPVGTELPVVGKMTSQLQTAGLTAIHLQKNQLSSITAVWLNASGPIRPSPLLILATNRAVRALI